MSPSLSNAQSSERASKEHCFLLHMISECVPQRIFMCTIICTVPWSLNRHEDGTTRGSSNWTRLHVQKLIYEKKMQFPTRTCHNTELLIVGTMPKLESCYESLKATLRLPLDTIPSSNSGCTTRVKLDSSGIQRPWLSLSLSRADRMYPDRTSSAI